MKSKRNILITSYDAQIRSEGDSTIVYGYAARYNVVSRMLSEGGKMFKEMLKQGAFDGVMDRSEDVVMVLDHDGRKLLGRTRANTLSLRADNEGLYFEWLPGNTTLSRDTLEMLKRGDISELSFKFTVLPSDEKWYRDADGVLKREVEKVHQLFDVSLLQTRAAYPNTVAIISDRDLEDIEKSLDSNVEENTENSDERASNEVTDNTDNADSSDVNDNATLTDAQVPENRVNDNEPENGAEDLTDERETESNDSEIEPETSDNEADSGDNTEDKDDNDVEQSVETDSVDSESVTEDTDNNTEKRELNDENTDNGSADERSNININTNTNNKNMKDLLLKSIREQLDNGIGGKVVLSERAAADGSTDVMGSAISNYVEALDIVGYEPIWKNMGVDVMPGAQGTFTLPYESPIVGELAAELAAYTKDTTTPSGFLISPKRFGTQKEFTVETLASATPEFINAVIADMIKAADRAITAELWNKMLAGSTQVASAADISKASFDALMAGAEVDGDGAFFSNRADFFAAKGTAIDAGSGRFLVEKVSSPGLGAGLVYDGTPYWYSNLFVSPVNEDYVIYGDAGKLFVADYGQIEIIVDKYTKAGTGGVILTVNKLAGTAIKNPNAFAKSADLNPA